jgi:uncharacterized protein (DUF779 family)
MGQGLMVQAQTISLHSKMVIAFILNNLVEMMDHQRGGVGRGSSGGHGGANNIKITNNDYLLGA